ncbi:MAG: LysR family transcriptional regulator [Pusillimonas sp.]
MKISTSQIDAFLALEETLRFSAAAERCHISTSAFSQVISRLEETVGARLFDRSTRHVALTPEGEVFSWGAKRIAAEVDATVSELRARVAGKSGQVTIAATPSTCVYWLPNIMRQFQKLYPGITLRLRDATSDRCLVMLKEGYADFAVIAQSGDSPEFVSTVLFDEPYHLLCLDDDPLARSKSIQLSQLGGRDYLEVVGQGEVWAQRKRDLRVAGVHDTGLEVANVGTMVGLIMAGFGIGLVPRMALPLCQREGLVHRPLKNAGFVRTFYLVKRSNRSLSLAACKMTDFLLNNIDAGHT